MKQLEPNSRKSVYLTFTAFTLIVITIILLVMTKSTELPAFVIGVPIVIAGLTSMVGLFYGVRSFPERSSTRKSFSLIFNAILFISFVAFMLGDLMST